MLDRTLNVQCNGASQRLCSRRRDLKPVNRLRHRRNQPRSFQNGEHMSGEEKSVGDAMRWEKCSVKRLQHDTKNTEQCRWLLMRDSVTTTLVVSQEGRWPAVSCGGQSNKYRVGLRPVSVASRSWVAVLSSSSSGCFSPGPYIHSSLNSYIWPYGNSYKNTKSSPPTGGVTQRSEDVTPGNPAKSLTPPQNTLNRFSLCSAKTTKKKKKRYIFENLQS